MPDLPDYYTQVITLEAEAYKFRGGADTSKSADPTARDVYFATDTKILYVCVVDGFWTGFDASILVQGFLTLYENMNANSNKIINLAAPTLANDAARKTYVDTLHALSLLKTGGTMSGPIAMGANKITGLADPTNAQDAATKAYVEALGTIYLLLAGGTMTGDINLATHKLKTTTLYLDEYDIASLAVRRIEDNVLKDFRCAFLNFHSGLRGQATETFLDARDIDTGHIIIRARDSGDALAEVARIQGAALAYWQMTRPMRLYPFTGAFMPIEGLIGYCGDDDTLKYRDATGTRTVSILTLAAIKAAIKLNELQPPDGPVAMNTQKITGLAAPTVAGDALRKGTALTITEMPASIKTIGITFIIDGGGAAITTGQKGHLFIPFACEIDLAYLMADRVGSIVVDIWKDAYAYFPPTDDDSITSATPPTITAAQTGIDSDLTGWTKAFAAGDVLAFNVDSCTTIQRVTLCLRAAKT